MFCGIIIRSFPKKLRASNAAAQVGAGAASSQAREQADRRIQELEELADWKNYTIEVHALKSASRQIGALELAKLAERLEQAGNEADGALIHDLTPALLKQYQDYEGILQEYFPADAYDSHLNTQKPPASRKDLEKFFAMLRTAFENLDMDQMEDAIEEMKQYSYVSGQEELFSQLCQAVAELDTTASEEILQMWEAV